MVELNGIEPSVPPSAARTASNFFERRLCPRAPEEVDGSILRWSRDSDPKETVW
jgi:hypothetical protein